MAVFIFYNSLLPRTTFAENKQDRFHFFSLFVRLHYQDRHSSVQLPARVAAAANPAAVYGSVPGGAALIM